jgi:hypothetical protein
VKNFSAVPIALLCLAGMWLYVDRVLIGHQVADAAAHDTPRGNLSDLYPIWLGSRELLLHKRNPYSSDVTREIQAGYYGRSLDPSRPQDPTNVQAFAYPVFVTFLLSPTVKLPFPLVRTISFWVLLAVTAASFLLWCRVLAWRPGIWRSLALIVFLLSTFAVVQGAKLQQLSLLVGALLAGSLALLVSGWLALSGAILALATIKPQLTIVLAPWLLLWSIANFRARWKFAAAFGVTLAGLIAGGEYLLPGWIRAFYGALAMYAQYAASGPLLDQMLTSALGLVSRILIAAGLAIVCWRTRKASARDEGFRLVTCLVLAATLLLIPLYPPHYQLLLLPGALFMIGSGRELWNSGLSGKVLLGAAAAPLLWSWIAAGVLAGVSFFTPAAQTLWQGPLWPTVVLPIPVTACLGLLMYRRAAAMSRWSSPDEPRGSAVLHKSASLQ